MIVEKRHRSVYGIPLFGKAVAQGVYLMWQGKNYIPASKRKAFLDHSQVKERLASGEFTIIDTKDRDPLSASQALRLLLGLTPSETKPDLTLKAVFGAAQRRNHGGGSNWTKAISQWCDVDYSKVIGINYESTLAMLDKEVNRIRELTTLGDDAI